MLLGLQVRDKNIKAVCHHDHPRPFSTHIRSIKWFMSNPAKRERDQKKSRPPYFLFINIAVDSAELARSAAHPKSFEAKSIIIITSGDEFPVMEAEFAAACTHNDILLSLAGLPCR